MAKKTMQKRGSGARPRRTSATGRALHDRRFPGESAGYRRARDRLLEAERSLRGQIEAVASMRRKLPLGGAVKEDYLFEEGAEDLSDRKSVRRVRLSELFGGGKESLVIYSFMYGPNMARPCPSCTSMLDSLDRAVLHAAQRINIAVVAKSPIQRIRDFAHERGWGNLRLLSSAGNTYNRDYYGETGDGSQWPALNVFVRRGGRVYHSYATELLFSSAAPGQEPRHVDLLWPIWSLFDLTPDGRGTGWHPKLQYD